MTLAPEPLRPDDPKQWILVYRPFLDELLEAVDEVLNTPGTITVSIDRLSEAADAFNSTRPGPEVIAP